MKKSKPSTPARRTSSLSATKRSKPSAKRYTPTGRGKPSKIKWIQIDTVYKIPTEHAIIDITTHIYKLHPKSNTSFIIELKDDTIQDYYFESKETLENHSLKEDINSFLSLLN